MAINHGENMFVGFKYGPEKPVSYNTVLDQVFFLRNRVTQLVVKSTIGKIGRNLSDDVGLLVLCFRELFSDR
jgi:hypothetical protein